MLSYNQNTQRNSCINCPTNCKFCSAYNEAPWCLNPDRGYYLNPDNSIGKCVEGCLKCTGTSQSDCYELQAGFAYLNGTIEECGKGCQSCSSSGKCQNCQPSYVEKLVADSTENNSPHRTGVDREVTCEPCNIDNCLYCNTVSNLNVKQNVCTSCESGYGKNKNGGCEKCPDNCAYCMLDAGRCLSCDSGKLLDTESGNCIDPPIPNCTMTQKDNKNKCQHCKSGFYLTTDGDQSECVSCSKLDESCVYCRSDWDPHVYNDNNMRILQSEPSHIVVPNPNYQPVTQPQVTVLQQPVQQPTQQVVYQQPVQPAPQPQIVYNQPVQPAPQPVQLAPQPVQPAPQPQIVYHQPVQPAPQPPTIIYQQPVQPAAQPQTIIYHQPAQQPVQPTQQPQTIVIQQPQTTLPNESETTQSKASVILEKITDSLNPFGKKENKIESHHEGVCLGCPAGARLNTNTDGKKNCVSCSHFCTSCNETICHRCIPGYYADELNAERKCEKCTLANCKNCKSSTDCYSCESGYYLEDESKQCKKCHSSCATCNGAGDSKCTGCSIAKFKMQVGQGGFSIMTFRMELINPFGSIFGG